MIDTSGSLLDRVRRPSDAAPWQRLVDLYTPLIRGWLCRAGLQPSDCDDLLQEILEAVVRSIAGFEHDGRSGSFRAWLRTITFNRLRNHWRAGRARPLATGDSDIATMLEQMAEPTSQLSRLWDAEHDQYVLRGLLEQIKPEFQPATWEAFRRQVLEAEPAPSVAAGMGKSVNAVLIAKSRVLQRLREDARGILDEYPS